MLQSGERTPHFDVTTISGRAFSYRSIWQQKNLLLVVLPPSLDDAVYASALASRHEAFRQLNCECVVTRDAVPGLSAPAVLIADQWGEIVHVAARSRVSELPSPDELLDWVQYVTHRCPECEGEAR